MGRPPFNQLAEEEEQIKKKYYKLKIKKSKKELRHLQKLEKLLVQMNDKIK
jgi:hypothetical protein